MDVAKTYFPNAVIASAPFHVISHLTKSFERLRLDVMNQYEYDSNAYYLLKKQHWLLEKDNVLLDNQKIYNNRFRLKLNKQDFFNMIMSFFPVLAKAYGLKEEYRKYNRESTYDDACDKLMEISKKFKNLRISQFDDLTTILFQGQEEILNFFRRPYGDRKLSNSFTDNINGRIRTYLAVSDGVNDFQRFRKQVIFALSLDVYYALISTLRSEKREGKKRGSYNKPKD